MKRRHFEIQRQFGIPDATLAPFFWSYNRIMKLFIVETFLPYVKVAFVTLSLSVITIEKPNLFANWSLAPTHGSILELPNQADCAEKDD